MSAQNKAPVAIQPDALTEAVDIGMEILSEERDALLTGRYGQLSDITQKKTDLLGRLEDAVRSAPRTRAVQRLVSRLIEASRYNEALLKAAREGLAIAKRRIAGIRKAGRGAVAYAEDGSTISSSGDRWTSEHLA